MADNDNKMEKIVSLAKRRGFVFQGSDIYGGLAGTYDFGPLGVTLKNNIVREWWKTFVENREDMYGLDASILMNEKVWEASGHTGAGFSDPIVECTKCHHRFRADHLDDVKKCPDCESDLGKVRNFNLMFETKVGAEGTVKSYLRPETAQGIFVNFKNVVDTMSPKIPFGIAQVGKAFRNEIAPRDFLFRVREFEQMEIEYFIREEEWKEQFEIWREEIWKWFDHIGLKRENVRELEVPENDLAHYSKRTVDFEFNFAGKGFDELAGFAYRTNHDLKSHMEASGTSLEYVEPDGNKFIPHVLEPSFGLGRTIVAVLSEAYTEDDMGGDTRVFLKLPAHLAPHRVAVSPLLKNKPELVEKARDVFLMLKKEFGNVAWDDNGNIGKRYRRQDEIGTPACVVIDFDTLGENPTLLDTVTVRDRDTGEQKRVSISELTAVLQ
ncbi:glycine--tRNA ligase [Candidatus Nomurabacteria bacterium]|nr:glycine--tRNA ligase [Candidatus Nomurabacteria bacterium]